MDFRRHGTCALTSLFLFAACTSGGSPKVEPTTSSAPPSSVGEGATHSNHAVVIRTPNGVTVHFTVAASSPMLTRFRTRYASVVADDRSNGHPPRPDFCRPEVSFQATLSIAAQKYAVDGVVNRGSVDDVRVLGFGSSERFVYVLAKAFRPVRQPLTVHLKRPAFSGTMTPLGDGFYVLAAPVGSPSTLVRGRHDPGAGVTYLRTDRDHPRNAGRSVLNRLGPR